MNENNKKNNPVVDPKIEAIKEIIFGENIKEYEDEFKKITELIKSHKTELEQKLESFRAEATSLIDDSNKKFSAELEEIKKHTEEQLKELDRTKMNRQTLSSMFQKLAKEIQA